MKYFYSILITLLILTQHTEGKTVKFSVDMTGLTVLSTGVHVAGDFQTLAGYAGGDFNAGTTQMFQEPTDTNIYSVVVNIPAFAKYEFRFFNGDQSYETEFIPTLSQIGYNFNDNRWIYVDSTANDTTFVGAIPFSGNAPAGKKLLRLRVDLQNQGAASANGVHVSGTFNNNSLTDERMYSFEPNVYEKIVYVNAGIPEYKFFNGNAQSDAETVPATCALNTSRFIDVATDTMANLVCFSGCDACVPSLLSSTTSEKLMQISPNPVQQLESFLIKNIGLKSDIKLYQSNGILVKEFIQVTPGNYSISTTDLRQGIYFIQVINTKTFNSKIVIQ